MTDSISRRRRATRAPGRSTSAMLWILQGLTAVAIVGAGLATVGGAAQPVAMFDQIGAGDWFRYLTGSLEVAGGLGLLLPRLCGLAGLALAALWVGAIATHLFLLGGNPTPAVVFFVVTALIAYGRRDRTTALWKGVIRLCGKESSDERVLRC